jgi:hypothetical protein
VFEFVEGSGFVNLLLSIFIEFINLGSGGPAVCPCDKSSAVVNDQQAFFIGK